uniref:C-type lectin domain-containing protein n=1 Tax=Cyprinodon variegatus TaxID=28743 RepID=A0A3Q2E4M2_CYPVA
MKRRITMERILLGAIFTRHYHFFSEPLTWNEAQTFCRQKYTDLATIENSEEHNLLYKTLQSAGYTSDVWIGLYSEIDWKWSDGYTGAGADYRHWRSDYNEPEFYHASQLCVRSGDLGNWWDDDCALNQLPFTRHYHFFSEPLTWNEAQTFCRQKYTDLATIENSEEHNLLYKTLQSAGYSSDVWIGLYSEIDWKWSDGYTGAGADYRHWRSIYNEPQFYNASQLCVKAGSFGNWWDDDCAQKRQFICNKGNFNYSI